MDQLIHTVSVAATAVAGAFSESESVNMDGTLAEGRTSQSTEKNRLLLAFARRIVDGAAKPFEVTYMLALMAADMPDEGMRTENPKNGLAK